MTDSNIVHSDVEISGLLKPETGFSDNSLPATDSPRRPEGDECLNTITPVANTRELLLQGQTTSHRDGSDLLEELVDVKVCDICGDAGREALLALCSVCSDGAEHTYCMRNKMDKVPENGWMCEECNGMQEPVGQTEALAGTGKAGSASKPSSLKELSQLSPRKSSIVPQAGKPKIKYFRKAFRLTDLRRGPSIEMRSESKKRKLEESIRPSKARTSSMKSIIDKEKSAAPLVSSFGEKPAKRACEPASSSGHKSEKRHCIGTPYKRETDDVSKSKVKVQHDVSKSKVKVQQSKDVLLSRINTAKENADKKLGKDFPDKKFLKSLSFAGSATSDVSNPQFFSIVKSRDLKCGVERDLPKNVHVPEKKTTRCLSSTRSCSMKVPSPRNKVVSEAARTLLVLNKSAIHACENIDVKTSDSLAQEGKKFDPLGEKLPSSQSSDAISCLKKNATLKANLNNSRKDSNNHSNASEKVLRHALYPVKPMPTLAPLENVPSRSSAVPAAEFIWKGGFKLEKSAKLPSFCSGVQAHVSSCASSKIHEVILKFGPKLEFKEVSRSETWRTYFPRNCPREQDIALYFFAEDILSYRRSYKVLLDGMMGKDLVLEASFDGIQLLVLPSSLLPVSSQRWNSLFYLWGVCKARKVEDQSPPRLAGLDVANSSVDLCTPVTNRSPSKCISTVEDGSLSASQTSHNTVQGQEMVKPSLLQSSALNKSSYQSCDHDTSSIKCLGVEEVDMKPDTVQSINKLKEETSLCRALHPDNRLEASQSDHQNIKCTSKMAAIFPFSQANDENDENMVSLAINSGGNGFYSNKFHSGPDVASHSSFSIDSGPSGSSDGCARSDEKHKEQLEKPSSSQSLSLDLSLGFNSQPEEQVVDLDLMLGFPAKSQPEPYTKSRNARDMNMSLFLSLGMPCSNA